MSLRANGRALRAMIGVHWRLHLRLYGQTATGLVGAATLVALLGWAAASAHAFFPRLLGVPSHAALALVGLGLMIVQGMVVATSAGIAVKILFESQADDFYRVAPMIEGTLLATKALWMAIATLLHLFVTFAGVLLCAIFLGSFAALPGALGLIVGFLSVGVGISLSYAAVLHFVFGERRAKSLGPVLLLLFAAIAIAVGQRYLASLGASTLEALSSSDLPGGVTLPASAFYGDVGAALGYLGFGALTVIIGFAAAMGVRRRHNPSKVRQRTERPDALAIRQRPWPFTVVQMLWLRLVREPAALAPTFVQWTLYLPVVFGFSATTRSSLMVVVMLIGGSSSQNLVRVLRASECHAALLKLSRRSEAARSLVFIFAALLPACTVAVPVLLAQSFSEPLLALRGAGGFATVCLFGTWLSALHTQLGVPGDRPLVSAALYVFNLAVLSAVSATGPLVLGSWTCAAATAAALLAFVPRTQSTSKRTGALVAVSSRLRP